jgi:hypothetical protein
MSLLSSKTWLPPRLNHKSERYFTKPKVAPAQSHTHRIGPHTTSFVTIDMGVERALLFIVHAYHVGRYDVVSVK